MYFVFFQVKKNCYKFTSEIKKTILKEKNLLESN